MEQLYNKFVETWNAEFPQEDPPLLDLHGCISTSADGFESVNITHLGKFYNESRETSKRLRRELKKAELIENFWHTLMKDCNGFESSEYSPRKSTSRKKHLSSSNDYDRKSSDEVGGRKYSLLDGLGKCVDSTLETFVNIGMGGDVIDVTDNHEIQVNAVVSGNQYLRTDNESSDGATGDNLVTQVCDNHRRDSGSTPNREHNSYRPINAGVLDNERKAHSDDDEEDEVNYENQCTRKLSASTERTPSAKPAIPPRRPRAEHPVRPKPPTVPRGIKLSPSSNHRSPHRSKGEPVQTKVNRGKHDLNIGNVTTRACTPETNLDELTGTNSFDNSSTASLSESTSSHKTVEVQDKDMLRKFRLSDGGKEKRGSGEVISTGYKHLSGELDTVSSPSEKITESSQKLSPESNKDPKNRKRLRSNDYENFSVDFLLTRRTPVFELDDEDDRDNRGSDIYDNVGSTGTKKSSDSSFSSADSTSITSLTSGEVCDSNTNGPDSSESALKKRPGDDSTSQNTQSMDLEDTENTQQKDEVDGKCHVITEAPGGDSEDTSDTDVPELSRTMSLSSSKKIRDQKLHMRKILVKGILESERTYLSLLKDITELKRKIQNQITNLRDTPMCSMEDVTTIFYQVEEIHVQHGNFVEKLQAKVDAWSDIQKVGDTFKELIVYFPMYMKYVNHTHEAAECILKCSNNNEEFRKLVSSVTLTNGGQHTLQELLFTPVQRLQRNTLVIHDLLNYTPEDHDDYKVLMKTLDLADHNLKNFATKPDSEIANTEDHLVKSGFVVEMVGNSRKLRFLFLFTDVLVCTKHKQTGRNRVNVFEVKWFLPVPHITMETKLDKVFSIKEDTESMKKKIVSLKAELRKEMKIHDDKGERTSWLSSGTRTMEKLKRKIEEQEAALILASPHLPLQFTMKEDSKNHCILLSTDYEREEWRDAVYAQQNHHHSGFYRQLSGHDVQAKINESKQLPQVNNVGNVLMKKDDEMLNGSLNVTIHKMDGLESPCDTYVQLHLDSYGYFFMQAKTRPCVNSIEPNWDQDFELELEGSQTLRILCYTVNREGEDELIGRSALELSRAWLSSSFKEQKISMNTLSLMISVRHTPATKTLKRSPSKIQGGLFGTKIGVVCNRERKPIPSFVTACIKEVEARGMEEVGVYRISGVTSEIQRIKKAFDKNLDSKWVPVYLRAGLNLLGDSDIHAVTGVLKLYFRELPEPLFTEASYKQFIATIGLHDGDSKEKVFLQLLHDLPNENYYCIVAIVEHLVRVSKYESSNKMSLSNLSTVFGPTLLHPAVSDQQNPAQLMQDAQDVFLQAGVLYFLLQMVANGKSIRRCESAIEMHGEDRLV
ncbi:active breakpoint cluster region-related protein-like isoform X2 [Saccostrea echinata]|uniref:active breakpoint cluster region-related protein-like isoform X2 n=1 Tax=Saccostrea echinata TaxID=191078 RepID=UPI002A810AF2|nr:active breakpoint cluster region-related protein-like isoform X2 [Saccostrea echinata]